MFIGIRKIWKIDKKKKKKKRTKKVHEEYPALLCNVPVLGKQGLHLKLLIVRGLHNTFS
jgi:hypothetical protein